MPKKKVHKDCTQVVEEAAKQNKLDIDELRRVRFLNQLQKAADKFDFYLKSRKHDRAIVMESTAKRLAKL